MRKNKVLNFSVALKISVAFIIAKIIYLQSYFFLFKEKNFSFNDKSLSFGSEISEKNTKCLKNQNVTFEKSLVLNRNAVKTICSDDIVSANNA